MKPIKLMLLGLILAITPLGFAMAQEETKWPVTITIQGFSNLGVTQVGCTYFDKMGHISQLLMVRADGQYAFQKSGDSTVQGSYQSTLVCQNAESDATIHRLCQAVDTGDGVTVDLSKCIGGPTKSPSLQLTP